MPDLSKINAQCMKDLLQREKSIQIEDFSKCFGVQLDFKALLAPAQGSASSEYFTAASPETF